MLVPWGIQQNSDLIDNLQSQRFNKTFSADSLIQSQYNDADSGWTFGRINAASTDTSDTGLPGATNYGVVFFKWSNSNGIIFLVRINATPYLLMSRIISGTWSDWITLLT